MLKIKYMVLIFDFWQKFFLVVSKMVVFLHPLSLKKRAC